MRGKSAGVISTVVVLCTATAPRRASPNLPKADLDALAAYMLSLKKK
jgi:hypothetical protein